jgi:spore germination protein
LIPTSSVGRTLVSTALLLVILLCIHPVWADTSGLPFNDISRSYAKDAIVRLSKLNLIDGTGNRRFEPTKPIKRAEFITMMDRLFGIEPVISAIPSFSDVSKKDWFYRWVQPSAQLGVATGTSSSKFEPSRNVTRQDAAVMLAAALKQQATAAATATGIPVYQDQSQISTSALPSVLQLQKLAVMQGDGTKFRPAAAITRQEAAVFMDRVLQHQGWADQIRSKPASRIQLGWQYASTTAQYEQQILQSNVNTLSPRWFYLDKSETVKSTVDPALVTWAHQHGKKVWAMLGNRSNDTLTHQILTDPKLQTSAIQSLINNVGKYGIDGLNVDFENVLPEDRDSLTGFVSDLGKQLRAIHVVLSVNVSPDLGTDWTEAFDYSALGVCADYIVLMGYDEHWGGNTIPGSVSSLPWLNQGLESLLAQVPSKKVIMAMPLYTRDWSQTASGIRSEDWSLVKQNDTVFNLKLQPAWNPELGQYVTVFLQQKVTHQLWLEDGRSLTAKIRLGESHGLAGYAYWYMGSESPDIWVSLRNEMKFFSYHF